MSKFMEDLQKKFSLWKATLKSKGKKVIINKRKLMESKREWETSRSKTDLCSMRDSRVTTYSILCTKCRCVIQKKMHEKVEVLGSLGSKFCAHKVQHYDSRKCGNREKLCDGVKTDYEGLLPSR